MKPAPYTPNNRILRADEVMTSRNGSALGGFNRRVAGWSYADSFRNQSEREDTAMHAGWDLADSMIRQGRLFYIHPFHNLECEGGYAHPYGGRWACEHCGKLGVERAWWVIKVFQDGNAWCCVGEGFEDLQASSNYAFGDTRDEAIDAYGRACLVVPA